MISYYNIAIVDIIFFFSQVCNSKDFKHYYFIILFEKKNAKLIHTWCKFIAQYVLFSCYLLHLTLLLLNTTCPVLANSVDPDQLASEEAN